MPREGGHGRLFPTMILLCPKTSSFCTTKNNEARKGSTKRIVGDITSLSCACLKVALPTLANPRQWSSKYALCTTLPGTPYKAQIDTPPQTVFPPDFLHNGERADAERFAQGTKSTMYISPKSPLSIRVPPLLSEKSSLKFIPGVCV